MLQELESPPRSVPFRITEGASVKLINTDGMALLGPGSEWFWTALSGIVLAVTFLAIYRQLALQRSQAAIEQLDLRIREWMSERLTRSKLEVTVALRDGVSRTDLPEAAADAIASYWEKIGNLARDGHLAAAAVWGFGGNSCRFYWELLLPCITRWRADEGNTLFEHFEWLAGVMADMDRRAKMTVIYDEARLTRDLERRIASFQSQLRVEQSLRAVIVASPEMVPTSEAPTATP